jgi:hypothetical protein
METLAMDGGVQPQIQPHQKSARSVDQKSDSQGSQILDSRVLSYRVEELTPHPAYIRHHLVVPAHKLSALSEQGDLAFREPLTITKSRMIIDGYARWEMARHQGRSTLPCLEYDLSEEESLQWILRTHQRSSGLNAFNRITLALDLETSFQERARSNQRAGGQYKGSSNLTEAERLDVRAEIAAAAGVAVGNITKVKQILTAVHHDLIEALRSGEISVHRAWGWRQKTPEEQRNILLQYRSESGIKKTIRELVSRHCSKKSFLDLDLNNLACRLSTLRPGQSTSVKVAIIKSSGKALYLTEGLAAALNAQQAGLC